MQDAGAFAALYDREAQAVLVFIARRTLDAELALDLTAETFAQAFRGRRAFRGSTEMEERAWLYRSRGVRSPATTGAVASSGAR
jgi:DNA-directed RNA polymerase specialized sigma24 family protein